MTPHQRGGNFGVKNGKLKYLLKTNLLSSGACFRQINCIVMMTKEGLTQNVNFMINGAGVLALGCGHISHIVKMHYSFKNLLYSHAWIRQPEYKVMMTKEGSTQIVNFMTLGTGVLMLGRGHISHIVNIYYLLLYQYTAH